MPRVSTLNYQSTCHQQIQHLTDSTDRESTPSTSTSSGASLLETLSAPHASELAMKRKVVTNPPHGKRKCRAGRSDVECVSNAFCGSFCACTGMFYR